MKPFASPKLLLRRANQHISEFEAVERAFVEKDPYALLTELDSASGQTIHKVRVTENVPDQIPAFAFDVVNCLRSALDHAVYDGSRLLLGGASVKPKETKFPFGKTFEDAERDLKRKKVQVPAVLQPYLLAFKPYQAGNYSLWGMNEIRRGVIHRILDAMPVASGGMTINPTNRNFEGVRFHMAEYVSEWDDQKRELTFMRTEGPQCNVQYEFAVHIAFSDETGFGRKSALEVLRQFSEICDGIVDGIEAETVRLIAE